MSTDPTTLRDVLILIPVYNDWEAVSLLLDRLDTVLAGSAIAADVLLVDDGSVVEPPARLGRLEYRALNRVDLLELRRNLGHQRAIAAGLCYTHDHLPARVVVVMDGDGEDAPEDVPRLLERLRENGGRSVVFAIRTRRSESWVFRVSYAAYRLAHVALTGIPVRVGNFSAIPAAFVGRLVTVPELWNHYAAAVFKAKLPRDGIPTSRAPRLGGQSRMDFVSLLSHGLSALSVHAELIGVRLLAATGVMAAIALALLGSVVVTRLATPMAIPGWASTIVGLLVLLLAQAVGFAVLFSFLVLHGRSQPGFIPARDYVHFVAGIRPWAEKP